MMTPYNLGLKMTEHRHEADTDHETRPTYASEDDVAVVNLLTKDALSRSGAPTRDPGDDFAYFPEDEWLFAIRYLLATPAYAEPYQPRMSVREAAAILRSKAARWAADSDSRLEIYCEIQRGKAYFADCFGDDCYVTQDEVDEARAMLANDQGDPQ